MLLKLQTNIEIFFYINEYRSGAVCEDCQTAGCSSKYALHGLADVFFICMLSFCTNCQTATCASLCENCQAVASTSQYALQGLVVVYLFRQMCSQNTHQKLHINDQPYIHICNFKKTWLPLLTVSTCLTKF